MKMFLKNGCMFFLLLLVFIFRNYLFNLISPIKIDNINNMYIESLKKENNELKSLIQIDNSDLNVSYGKVIYQNPYHFKEELKIKTTSENIKVNDLVISNDGLIGKISKVSKNIATVEMITNKNFVISIKVNDYYGVLKNNGNIYIDNIDSYANINIDDIVYTSNLTGQNLDIKIGYINNIIESGTKISKKYEIKLASNLNYLNYVAIVGAS